MPFARGWKGSSNVSVLLKKPHLLPYPQSPHTEDQDNAPDTKELNLSYYREYPAVIGVD